MSDDLYYSPFPSRDRLIHIVDTDIATCEALSVLFRLEGFHTSFSTDTRQFAIATERRRPDGFLINMVLGEQSGLDLLRRVKAMPGELPVVMLVDMPDVMAAVSAMKLGAIDVISKPIDSDYLLSVLRNALRIGLRNGRTTDIRGFSQLTPRERQVLHLITSGQSNKEAGRELGISPRTIEVHRARVMEKLGARNTADLMRIVLVG